MTDEGENRPDSNVDGLVQSVLDAAERAASEILSDATLEAQRRVTEARQRAEALGQERVEMMSALSDSLLEQATTVKRQSDLLIEALDRVIASLELELDTKARPSAAAETPAKAPPPPARPSIPGARPAPPPLAPPTVAAAPPSFPPAPAPAPSPPPAPAPSRQDSETRQRALLAIRERIASSVDEAARAPQQQPPPPTRPKPPVVRRPAAPAPPRAPSPQVGQQLPSRKPVSEQAAEGARILATQMAVAGSSRAEILVRLRKEFGIADPEPIVDSVVDNPGAS